MSSMLVFNYKHTHSVHISCAHINTGLEFNTNLSWKPLELSANAKCSCTAEMNEEPILTWEF